jgi:hypothetical protein
MALCRLKHMLGAFEHIDAAIEAGTGAEGCRDEFRSTRARIVQMMRDAADGDNEKVEGLCVFLDEAMVGSLATLLEVPPEKTKLAFGGLVGAVDTLMREHPSERVRGLACDVVRGWSVTPLATSDSPRREQTQGSIVGKMIRIKERFLFRFSLFIHNVHTIRVTTTWLISQRQLSGSGGPM